MSTTIYHSQNTDIDTSAEVLDSSAPTDCLTIVVKALAGNGNTVYVGNTGVTTGSGFPLAAGETLTLVADRTTNKRLDASAVYVIGGAADQGAALICTRE